MSALGCPDVLGGPAAPRDLNLTPFPPPLYHSCTLHKSTTRSQGCSSGDTQDKARNI